MAMGLLLRVGGSGTQQSCFSGASASTRGPAQVDQERPCYHLRRHNRTNKAASPSSTSVAGSGISERFSSPG